MQSCRLFSPLTADERTRSYEIGLYVLRLCNNNNRSELLKNNILLNVYPYFCMKFIWPRHRGHVLLHL